MTDPFLKNNKDGTPKTCKFCHRPVWWHQIQGRWYDVGGETLHVDNCQKRKDHFKQAAYERCDSRRQGGNP